MLVAGEEFKEAMERELKNWRDNEVYKEMKDNGQECISTRWVCK